MWSIDDQMSISYYIMRSGSHNYRSSKELLEGILRRNQRSYQHLYKNRK